MKIKQIELTICLLLAVFLAYCAAVSWNQSQLADGVVRLRVIADNDDMHSQSQKLLVRDAVIENCNSMFSETDDADNIRKKLTENLDTLCECVRSVVGDQTFVVTIKECRYPTRTYGRFSLPAGRYVGVQIHLGAAQGKNWWCVLYPSLCTDAYCDMNERYTQTLFSLKSAEWISALCERFWA